MKTLQIFLLFISFAVLGASAQKAPVYGKYTWYEGLDKARSEGKSFFVFVSQKGCAYCKELDKNLAANPAVLTFLQEKFVLARHSTSTPYGKALAMDYKLQTTPALIVQNPLWEEDPLILYGMSDPLVLRAKLEAYLSGKKE